jgi:cyanate lyase
MANVEFSALTQALLAAKRQKGLTFADLEALLGRDEVWVASLFYGQSAASEATFTFNCTLWNINLVCQSI